VSFIRTCIRTCFRTTPSMTSVAAFSALLPVLVVSAGLAHAAGPHRASARTDRSTAPLAAPSRAGNASGTMPAWVAGPPVPSRGTSVQAARQEERVAREAARRRASGPVHRSTSPASPASAGTSASTPWRPGPAGPGQPAVTGPPAGDAAGQDQGRPERHSGGTDRDEEPTPSTSPTTPALLTHAAHRGGRWVALTFDDGPSPVYTPQVLALLRAYRAKATFCVVGTQARQYPDLVRQIVAEGHLLCNHTMTHDVRLPTRPAALIRGQLRMAQAAIRAAVPDAEVDYYRAPGGAWSAEVRQIAADMGMKSLGWTVDSRDWQRPGVSAILANTRRELAPGGVILLHDGGGDRAQSVAALRLILVSLRAGGYKFDFPG
jgi:peptidoglycan-N-acetylglucosamine deacetylase